MLIKLNKIAPKYWKVLKGGLKDEGNENVTNCNALKMIAKNSKLRETDVLNTKGI